MPCLCLSFRFDCVALRFNPSGDSISVSVLTCLSVCSFVRLFVVCKKLCLKCWHSSIRLPEPQSNRNTLLHYTNHVSVGLFIPQQMIRMVMMIIIILLPFLRLVLYRVLYYTLSGHAGHNWKTYSRVGLIRWKIL